MGFTDHGWDCAGVDPGRWGTMVLGVRPTLADLPSSNRPAVVGAIDCACTLSRVCRRVLYSVSSHQSERSGSPGICKIYIRSSPGVRSQGAYGLPSGSPSLLLSNKCNDTLQRDGCSDDVSATSNLARLLTQWSALGVAGRLIEVCGPGDQVYATVQPA